MSNRRTFIRQLSLLAGTSLAGPCLPGKKPVSPNIGLQLYTLRNELGKDAMGTLQRVAELGFKEVESFGFNGKFFGMDAKTYRDNLKGLGLNPVSGHYLYGNMGNRQMPGTVVYGWDQAVAYANELGQQYMVLAYLFPPERKTLDDYKQIAAALNKAAEACKKAGIQLCYHNHDFEFEVLEGSMPFDVLMRETDKDLVKIELDLYWVSKVGQSALSVFDKYPGRTLLWHVKDMDKTEKKSFTEVGNGVIDFKQIFAKASHSGMKHYFVEQDQCPGPPFESINQSIQYIKKNLI